MRTKITLTLSAILLASILSVAQTIVPAGAVEGIWTLSNSPYRVDSAIYVANSKILTIEAGVVVRFNTTERFEIYGCLLAEGTEQDTILFTNHDQLIRWGGIKWINTLSTNDSSKIAYCIFERAFAYGPELGLNSGAALAVKNFNKISVQHSTFRFNLASQDGLLPPCGAAIGLWSSSAYISHCIFHDNNASYGGAIIYHLGSNGTTDNCLFYGNKASAYGGAIEVYDNSSPYIINCTFADNHAEVAGGVIDVYESVPNLTNCILWDNTADIGGSQGHIRYYSSGLNTYNCNIQEGDDGFTGYANIGLMQKMIDTLPGFIGDGGLFPYAIDANSPCKDYGTLNPVCLPENWTCPSWDLADQPRNEGTNIDLGAYESQLPTRINENAAKSILGVGIFPNPVTDHITIDYTLSQKSYVSLHLFTLTGKRLCLLKNQWSATGEHQQHVDLSNLPPGGYIIKLQSGDAVKTLKIVKR